MSISGGMTALLALERLCGWSYKRVRNTLVGFCPFHEEYTPSFVYYFEGDRFCCYGAGCQRTGHGLYGVLKYVEFGGRDDKETRRAIMQRCDELNGVSPREWTSSISPKPLLHLNPPATQEQQAFLSLVGAWWHNSLFGEGEEAKAAREYIEGRGISLDWVEANHGYVGFCPRGTPTTLASLKDTLLPHFGERWYPLAKETGVLSQRGAMRLSERIMFLCRDEKGSVLYYQGRTLLPLTKTHTRAKYLGPPLRKYPFRVPIPPPQQQGTSLVEGPVEAILLAQYGLRAIAHMGSGLALAPFLTMEEAPYYAAHHHDVPDPSGVQAGEKLATKAIAACQKVGVPVFRVRPPLAQKSVDEWILAYGINAYLDALPSKRERAS